MCSLRWKLKITPSITCSTPLSAGEENVKAEPEIEEPNTSQSQVKFSVRFFHSCRISEKKSSTITKIMFCLAALIVIIKDKQCTWSNLY